MFACSYRHCQVKNVPPKKSEIPKGRVSSQFGILRAWGVTHSGISKDKRGLKHGSRPWLGMDIFWNCPFAIMRKLHITASVLHILVSLLVSCISCSQENETSFYTA